MDYRKLVNGKKKLATTIENVKNLAVDKSKEVKEYAGSTVDDVKTNISNTVKNKLTNEFRKNYPAYAVAYIDNIIVNAFVNDTPSIIVSKNEENEVITISAIFDEIAEGMVSDEILSIYKNEKVLNSLFDYLAMYYETESQLDVVVTDDIITISMIKETETTEDSEIKVDIEKEEV